VYGSESAQKNGGFITMHWSGGDRRSTMVIGMFKLVVPYRPRIIIKSTEEQASFFIGRVSIMPWIILPAADGLLEVSLCPNALTMDLMRQMDRETIFISSTTVDKIRQR
jgi:hypothetical protein